MSTDTTVSLEEHLAQLLQPLLSVLPSDLCASLATELRCSEIHTSVLYKISRWARTDPAKAVLASKRLDPRAYDNVVSLLAGTRTAPRSVPPPDAKTSEEVAREELRRSKNDRKALAMIVNGSLSVICSGAAGWWAADKAHWKDEWKVLLALIIALVVGVAETVLFIIWQSRANSPAPRRRPERRQTAQTLVKSENDGETPSAIEMPHGTQTHGPDGPSLRRRTARHPELKEGSPIQK